MAAGLLGCIVTPAQGNRILEGVTLAVDNGCFGAGYPGDREWWAWLQKLPADRVKFAVAPDVVADARATLERSAPWLPRIRAAGFPAAFVAQDGLEEVVVPWDEFDALFVGGSTPWKLGAAARDLIAEAKARGKWVHMGRVNSLTRLRRAAFSGCDSADGTYIAFGPDRNLPRMLGFIRNVNALRFDFD